jgi:hypothetical protein
LRISNEQRAEGGDLTVVTLNGNIDAGKGAKTVQAIQPPSVSYAGYGHLSITPFIVEFLGFGGSDGLPANGGEGKRGGGQQPESGPQR